MRKMTLLLHGTAGKVYFIWVLLQETAWLFQTNLMHTLSKNKSVSEEVNGSLEKMRRARVEFCKGNYCTIRYGATPQNAKDAFKYTLAAKNCIYVVHAQLYLSPNKYDQLSIFLTLHLIQKAKSEDLFENLSSLFAMPPYTKPLDTHANGKTSAGQALRVPMPKLLRTYINSKQAAFQALGNRYGVPVPENMYHMCESLPERTFRGDISQKIEIVQPFQMPFKYECRFDPQFCTFSCKGCNIYHVMTFIWGALSQGNLIYMTSDLELETFQAAGPIKDTKFQSKPAYLCLFYHEKGNVNSHLQFFLTVDKVNPSVREKLKSKGK
ncbi:hypothetical protein llap_1887 [Limosa lapponica baueri]|uniref:Uncharacterized protein n=1 Tax=Limosa lapponica baueri TaxID=1758121 RepID=A0A2I0UNZ6_LIMLA|nr:hypothetical protein llap_1887 [Limosa lapponica baueri]